MVGEIGARKASLSRKTRFSLIPVALTILLAILLFALFANPAQAVSYSADEVAFVQLLNDYRVSQGLQPLLVSDMISEACDRHSSDMGKYRFFDHYTTGGSDWFPIGASPWDRMAASGYTYNTYKGENIAAGYSTAAAVFNGWKNSPGHNANMLGANYKVLGVSLVYVAGSPYGYYWTTDFGGYVDATAHSLGSAPTTTTTAAPTTTTTAAPTTTTTAAPTTTTTAAPTTTTTAAPTTTTTATPPTTMAVVQTTTTTTAAPTTTTTRATPPPLTTTTTTTVYAPPPTTTTTAAPTTTTTKAAPTTTTTAAPTTTTTLAPPPPTAFSDVGSATLYAAEIGLLADRGAVSGYGDGTFGPYDLVTRQQFAKMIVLTLGLQVSQTTACNFTDVVSQYNAEDPLYPGAYIAVCAAAGITEGRTPTTFAPYDYVTRAQLITMVARAAGLSAAPEGYQPPFGDFSPDHYPWAVRAAYAGLLDGLIDMGADFDFWAPATRAEVCLLLAGLLG